MVRTNGYQNNDDTKVWGFYLKFTIFRNPNKKRVILLTPKLLTACARASTNVQEEKPALFILLNPQAYSPC